MSLTAFPHPPRAKGSDTSSAAATSMVTQAVADREIVYRAVFDSGARGMTSDEIEHFLGYRHQNASARLHDLTAAGRVIPVCWTRTTRSGRQAHPYVATVMLCSADRQLLTTRP